MDGGGKVALVTGGSRGIGRAVCVRLAAAGTYVYVNYLRGATAAAETVALIRQAGGEAVSCPFDVADATVAAEAIAAIVRQRQRLDILVNNAGISRDGLLLRLREAELDAVLATNLKGCFHCSQAAAKPMVRQRWGRIINISSVVGEAGNAGQSAYAAAKAGIIGLTKSLARELASRNVCVNAVAPGFIATDMTVNIPQAARERLRLQIPLGRLGTPEDVAGIVAFLASEEAGYITGQVVRVNGGLYL